MDILWAVLDVGPSCLCFFPQLPLLTWCCSAWPWPWSCWPFVSCSLHWRTSLCHLKVSFRGAWTLNLHPQSAGSGSWLGSSVESSVWENQAECSCFLGSLGCVQESPDPVFSITPNAPTGSWGFGFSKHLPQEWDQKVLIHITCSPGMPGKSSRAWLQSVVKTHVKIHEGLHMKVKCIENRGKSTCQTFN